MRRINLYLLAAAATTVAIPAAAQKITFSSYNSPTTTEYQATVGAPVTAGGFDFYDTDAFVAGARNVLGTWGTADAGAVHRPTNIGSSTAMFATQLREEIDIFRGGVDIINGPYTPFNIFSMDVGHLYSTAYSPFTLLTFTFTVYGFGAIGTGNNLIQQSFSIAAPLAVGGNQNPLLQTLVFDSRWHDMDNVFWYQSSGSGTAHQFTNIMASVVPEPSTYALMMTGLLATGLARRRKQTRS